MQYFNPPKPIGWTRLTYVIDDFGDLLPFNQLNLDLQFFYCHGTFIDEWVKYAK